MSQIQKLRPATSNLTQLRIANRPYERVKSHDYKSFDHIYVGQQNNIHRFEFNEIVHFQAHGNYTYMFLSNSEKMVITKTIKNVMAHLPHSRFIRIHQSHIINVSHIQHILNMKCIALKNKTVVPISRKYKIGVKQWVQAFPNL